MFRTTGALNPKNELELKCEASLHLMNAHQQDTKAIPDAKLVRKFARVRSFADVSPEDRGDSTPNSRSRTEQLPTPEAELNNSQLQKPNYELTMFTLLQLKSPRDHA